MRPIDADALKETKYVYHDNGEVGERLYISFDEIDNAPTVDAVPVVRCKDCKYFIQMFFFGNKMNMCRLHGSSMILPTARIVADDWFCAGGERWKE